VEVQVACLELELGLPFWYCGALLVFGDKAEVIKSRLTTREKKKKKARRLKRCGDPIGNRCPMLCVHRAHRVLVNYQVASIQYLLHCLYVVPIA
jgi:hypothetical protein